MKLIDVDKLKQMLAKQYKDTVLLIRNGETHLDSLAEGYTECAQAIEKLILFENADKYRWHDLLENPEDLPPEQCEVLTKITDSLNQYVHYETSWVIDGDTWVNSFGKPIAWRYIEPFKEET